jgi:hypothetical protein
MRSFGMVWSITIPSIVFNSQFDHRLHEISDVQARLDLAGGGAYGLVSGSYVQSLPTNVQKEIVMIYSEALKTVWEVGVGFALFCFLLVFLERHVDLRKELKTEYGVADDSVQTNLEAQKESPIEEEVPTGRNLK